MATILRGIEYLRKKLKVKEGRVNTRYKFYEMKNLVKDMRISTPPQLYNWFSCLGWCGLAVDNLADRLSFLEFRNDNFSIGEIFDLNNPDVLYDSAILSALIASCSFVYISKGPDEEPRLQVIDGANATGVIDPITGLLTEGYAVLERDDNGEATREAYFEPRKTTYYTNGRVSDVWTSNVDYPLLVPIIYRPDAKRPFGRSRISRACMDIMSSAIRTIKRSEISAEFYSFPQKYVTGLDDDAQKMDKWSAAMSAMMQFGSDEKGNHPVVGQFQQQTMSPHIEQLRMFAALFGGHTGLTLDDLGFATGNPASAEAIKAAHENLRLSARKAQKCFGTGFLNVGFVAAQLRDNQTYNRKEIRKTVPVWEPVFEPDAAMMSQIGDGVIKINQAMPEFFDQQKLSDLTGVR